MPATALEAKRLNEQIKLIATTINGVAIATASIFGLSEFAKSETPDATLILVFVAIALHFHTVARSILGQLKDEARSAESACPPPQKA